MNHTVGLGRPSRNTQGICGPTFPPTTMPTTPVPETPANSTAVPPTPVTTPLAQGTPSPGNNSAVQDTSSTDTPIPMPVATRDGGHEVEVLTSCTRQYNRFVDSQGRPLQAGTVIFCDDLPFVVSTNGRIYILPAILQIAGNLTSCTRQYDRFFDPQGMPLQAGTVIFWDDLPFVMSTNGRICMLPAVLLIARKAP